MLVKNCHHNSGKQKKGKGISKGRLRARKQALQHLKRQLMGGVNLPSLIVK